MRDIVQCQRTGAAGGKTGDDASGSDAESGDDDTDSREHRGQIQGVDWKPESKERYFRKAEAAVKAAGFDDILRVDRDQFSVVKGTVKVHFKPISRDGKTRRWWEAKRTIENMHEVPPAKDQFGKKHKSIFIHAFMILEMEEQDK